MSNITGSLPIEGGTLTGPLVLAGDPAAALQAATKQYVDAAAGGGGTGLLPVLVVDETALTVTYNNGAGTLTNAGAQAAYSADGITPAVGDRILIAGQVSQFQNGIYTLTDAGSGVTNWVMTRATDYDVAAEMIPGVLISVLSGTLYGGTIWIQSNTITTVGTDALNFGNILNYYAYSNLSNLTTTFINDTLGPDGDNLYDIGGGDAWRAVYAHTYKTSPNGLGLQSYILQGYDQATAAYIDWITITRANPGTCVLHGDIETVTQLPNDNSDKIASTAYADAAAAAGGAPANATYITQTPDAGLSNEQSLSVLATGILKSTTATGVISIAAAGTDYYAPGGSDVVVADGGTGRSSHTAYAVICGGTTATNPQQSIASVGTAGQVLTSNGAGALPTFQTNPSGAGAISFLASATAAASATLDITTSIDGTYDAYLLIGSGLVAATDSVNSWLRVSTDGGGSWAAGTSYTWAVAGEGTGVNTSAAAAQMSMQSSVSFPIGNAAGETFSFETMFFNPSSASLYKQFKNSITQANASGNVSSVQVMAANYKAVTAINGVRLIMSSGNITSGTIRLYGIRNS